MAFPSISDIVATTIESRSRTIADNVLNNNAGLAYIKARGNVKPVSGGSEILEEVSFAENGNAGWYSGYDLLPVAAQDVISAARFSLKQAAVPVVISGLEQLQNAGREQMIDLLDARITVAESTMANLLSDGFYSDGAGAGGKEIVGLDAAVPTDTTTGRVDNGTYGGIDRANWSFWRPYYAISGSALTATTIQASMNAMWAQLVRGRDQPDLIIADSTMWALYMASLQAQQRFTDPNSARLGFPTIKFMTADVVLDGGLYFPSSAYGPGAPTKTMWSLYMASLQAQQRFTDPNSANLGFSTVKFMNADVVLDGGLYFPSSSYGPGAPTKTMFFLNTKYLKWRPHSARDMVPLAPNKRYAINQDAEVQILAWAGALTCSGQAFQGRLVSA